jgi:hypothetical protein
MPSSPRNLKAAAWGWRSVVPSWKCMVDICGPHRTTDEARHFISLSQPQSWKCLWQYDSEYPVFYLRTGRVTALRTECGQHPPSMCCTRLSTLSRSEVATHEVDSVCFAFRKPWLSTPISVRHNRVMLSAPQTLRSRIYLNLCQCQIA